MVSRSGAPGGLDSPSADILARCAHVLARAVNRRATESPSQFDVSPIEFAILNVCMNAEETTVTELSKEVPVDAGRISRLVNNLFERGLIRRQRLRKDRRVVRLRLSEEGRNLVPVLNRRVRSYSAMLTDGVSETDMDRFVSVIRTIAANHQAAVEAAEEAAADE